MPPGDLRNVAQVTGEGQVGEHHDGLYDVIVDDVTLFTGQGAAGCTQVVQFATVELVQRHIQLKPPLIVGCNQFRFRPCMQMLSLVCQ